MSNAYTIHIDPISKPRMTQRDKWQKRKCVTRYWDYKDELRAKMRDFAGRLEDGHCHVVFHLKMPKSWSKKRRAEYDGKPHQQKPDVDNLCKGMLDALYEDDSGVWDIRTTKRWAEEGRIEIWI